jgi:hypothetical protein
MPLRIRNASNSQWERAGQGTYHGTPFHSGEHRALWSRYLAGLSGPGELSFAHPGTPQIPMVSRRAECYLGGGGVAEHGTDSRSCVGQAVGVVRIPGIGYIVPLPGA